MKFYDLHEIHNDRLVKSIAFDYSNL